MSDDDLQNAIASRLDDGPDQNSDSDQNDEDEGAVSETSEASETGTASLAEHTDVNDDDGSSDQSDLSDHTQDDDLGDGNGDDEEILLASPIREEWDDHYAYLLELDSRHEEAWRDLEYLVDKQFDIDVNVNRRFNVAAWHLALDRLEDMVDSPKEFIQAIDEIGVLDLDRHGSLAQSGDDG